MKYKKLLFDLSKYYILSNYKKKIIYDLSIQVLLVNSITIIIIHLFTIFLKLFNFSKKKQLKLFLNFKKIIKIDLKRFHRISFSFYNESHQSDPLMSPDFSCAETTSNNSA